MTDLIKFISDFKLSLKVCLFLFLLTILTTACKPLVFHEQSNVTDYISIRSDESVGQTFVSRFDGLEGIALYIQTDRLGEGVLRLILHTEPENNSEIIRESSVTINEIKSSGYIRFQFKPIIHSTNQYYYARLTYEGQNSVRIGIGPGESYLSGALYSNDSPLDAQAALRMIHKPELVGIGILTELLSWLGKLAPAMFLFVLPGWAVLSNILPGWSSIHWGERLGLSIGASLSIYPIFILWTHLLGFHLGWLYAWIPVVFSLMLLGWNYVRLKFREKNNPHMAHAIPINAKRVNSILAEVALITVILLVIFSRLWIIRNVDIPLYGDSYQHTVITQLLIDHDGLFNSWQPYADLTTFTYHFGFHTFAAAFHWFTGTPSPQAVLWTGQLINILSILAIIPLATRIGRSVWSGVVAVLIAGLLTQYPMVYVNWGRYTQLAGQAILPSLVYLIWTAAENNGSNWKIVGLTCIIWGSLALTHYRILMFAILFFVASWILFIRDSNRLKRFVSIVSPAILGAILFLPWLIRMYSGNMDMLFDRLMTSLPSQDPSAINPTNVAGMAFSYLPVGIWLFMLLGIGWGLVRRDRGIILVSIWWVLILFVTNPNWVNLPGAGIITNFTTLIAVYIPASIIVGSTAGWLLNSIQGYSSHVDSAQRKMARHNYSPMIYLAVIVSLGIWGAWLRLSDLRLTTYALVTRPDLRAATWIQENTPVKAKILVNSFLAYGGYVAVGSDAGWWLPIIAERAITIPPINLGFEEGPFEGYRDWINSLTSAIRTKGIGDQGVLKMLEERGVTHIFIGQQQGHVNNPGIVLDPNMISTLPQFTQVYHEDRVWVFKVNDTPK